MGARPYDLTPARLDFCNWEKITASSLYLHLEKLNRGGGREEGRETEMTRRRPHLTCSGAEITRGRYFRTQTKRDFFWAPAHMISHLHDLIFGRQPYDFTPARFDFCNWEKEIGLIFVFMSGKFELCSYLAPIFG